MAAMERVYSGMLNEFSRTDLVEVYPLKGVLTLVLAHKKVLKVNTFLIM